MLKRGSSRVGDRRDIFKIHTAANDEDNPVDNITWRLKVSQEVSIYIPDITDPF